MNAINLTAFTTRDLYVRVDRGFSLSFVASGFGTSSTLTFSEGPIFQHRLGQNVARVPPVPSEDDPSPAPLPACVEFDSYFALGVLAPELIQVFPPPEGFDATSPQLRLLWLTLGAGAEAIQNSTLFGDSQFYARVARFTVPNGATVQTGSEIEAGIVLNGAGSTTTAKVALPAFGP